MGIRSLVSAVVCAASSLGAIAASDGAQADSLWTTTIASGRLVGCHESPCRDDIEGIVIAQKGASKRCVAGRTIEIVEEESGLVVGHGVTNEDGTFLIPSDDETFELIARVLERRTGRHRQNICACAQTEVSLFVE